MITFSDTISNNGHPVPISFTGKAFYLDPVDGNDGNDGTSPDNAVKTMTVAYNLLTSYSNDVLYIIDKGTDVAVTAVATWTKNYVHMVGISPNRVTVSASSGSNIAKIATQSGNGCTFTNINFINYSTTTTSAGALLVTGTDCTFTNCNFKGACTDSSAVNIIDNYSLQLKGAHRAKLVNCRIGSRDVGLVTSAKTLIISTSEDVVFRNCDVMFATTVSAMCLIHLKGAHNQGTLLFDNCRFFDHTLVAYVDSVTDVIANSVTSVISVILHGCSAFNFAGWTNNVETHAEIYLSNYTAGGTGIGAKAAA